jgi:hypothetical protein
VLKACLTTFYIVEYSLGDIIVIVHKVRVSELSMAPHHHYIVVVNFREGSTEKQRE